MKLVVFSDIHSNLQALEAILEDIKKEKIDKIICLGDVIGVGPNPKECLDLIIENNIDIVLGNHELYYVYGTKIDNEMGENEANHHNWVKKQLNDKHFNFLKEKTLFLEINNMLFEHFIIKNDRKEFYPFYDVSILKDKAILNLIPNYEKTFVGHEHIPFNLKTKNKELIGIGSSGCGVDNQTHYTILEISKEIIINNKIIKYDRDGFIKNLKDNDYPDRNLLAKIFFGMSI